MVAASATGSRPLECDGMHVLSLDSCHIVDSQVPFCPVGQLVGDEQGWPILQVVGVVHRQAKVASNPVGWLPLQPGSVGIC